MTYFLQLILCTHLGASLCANLLFQGSNSARALYQQALQADATGQRELSTAACQQLLKQFPDSEFAAPATIYVAQWQHRAGNHRDCYQLLSSSQAKFAPTTAARRNFLMARSALGSALNASGPDESLLWLQRIDWTAFAPDSEEESRAVETAVRVIFDLIQDEENGQQSGREIEQLIANLDAPKAPRSTEHPRTCALRFAYAEALTQSGKLESALKQWETLTQTFAPGSSAPTWLSTALLRKAECLLRTKNYPELAESLEASSTMAEGPTKHELLLLKARLAIQQIKFNDAHAILSLLSKNPNVLPATRAETQWRIGELFFLQKNYARACEAYELAEQFGEPLWSELAQLQRGKCLELSGQLESAKRAYLAVLDSSTAPAQIQWAQERLAVIDEFETARMASQDSLPDVKR